MNKRENKINFVDVRLTAVINISLPMREFVCTDRHLFRGSGPREFRMHMASHLEPGIVVEGKNNCTVCKTIVPDEELALHEHPEINVATEDVRLVFIQYFVSKGGNLKHTSQWIYSVKAPCFRNERCGESRHRPYIHRRGCLWGGPWVL